jgi:hypothetical protein
VALSFVPIVAEMARGWQSRTRVLAVAMLAAVAVTLLLAADLLA